MKIVAVDGLPAELPIEKGLAPVLLAQPTYKWGYVGVQTIFEKVHEKKERAGDSADGTRSRVQGQPGHVGTPVEGLGLHGRARGLHQDAVRAARRPANTDVRTMDAQSTPQPGLAAVSFRGITKRFPGVLALEDVSFDIAPGSMHALCGENGAGKSTLGKILAGIHEPDAGEVLLFGRPLKSARPEDALAAGVGMVHQELAFCENLSVAENLCLRALPRTGPFCRAGMERQARELLAVIDASIDVHRLVGDLTIGQQQVLQIAAAVGHGARVIVFDEPTSSLSQHEAEKLYQLIGRLQTRGVTGIYVTHRMEEIFRLCDTITVLRDGRHVSTQPASSLDTGKIVEMMIGRKLAEYFPPDAQAAVGRERLRVTGLSSPAGFQDVSFAVASGESSGWPVWLERADRRWRARFSASTHARRDRSSWTVSPCGSARLAKPWSRHRPGA